MHATSQYYGEQQRAVATNVSGAHGAIGAAPGVEYCDKAELRE